MNAQNQSFSTAQRDPSVLVLLAAYQGARHLGAQVESILGQRGVDVQLVVRVDPSTDPTLEIAQRYARTDPRVRVVCNETPSGGAAQNFFTLLGQDLPSDGATTPYSPLDLVAFSDQDDIWLPDKLSRAAERLRAERADGYSSNVIAWWPQGSTRLIDKSQPQRFLDHRFSAPGPGCTFVITPGLAHDLRRALAHAPDIARRLPLHDWLIYAWSRHAGYRWTIDPEPTILYRQHPSNVIGVNVGARALRARLGRDGRSWYLTAVDDITQFLQRTAPPEASSLVPLDRRHIIRQWRELRRPRAEAALCAAIVLRGHGRRALRPSTRR